VNPDLLERLAPGNWPTLVLLTARTLGVVLTAPGVSLPMVPVKVRAALVVVVTAAVLPATPSAVVPEGTLALAGSMAGEVLIGAALGLTASLLMHAVAIAGDVMATQTGLSMAVAYDPSTDAGSTEISRLWGILALVLYLALGGPLLVIGALNDSVRLLPPGGPINIAGSGEWIAGYGSAVFRSAVMLAAPVMVALFLANVGLAMLTKAVQQISAFTVSFPITIGLGLLTLAASLPYGGALVARWMESLPRMLRWTLAAFASPAGG
jgi:flagellar biosynthetic protein FliR